MRVQHIRPLADALLLVSLVMPVFATSTYAAQSATDAGNQIVYAAGEADAHTLYTMNNDGTNARKLVTKGDNTEPDWSPDRTRIAFSSRREEQTNIYVVNADGSGEQQITQSSGPTSNTQPRWSPDGKSLAFVSNRTGSLNVYTIQVDGGNIQQITREIGSDSVSPTWSPDGTQLAYSSNKAEAFEIYVTDRAGKNPRSINKKDDGDRVSPVWSPDGKQIAYVLQKDGDGIIMTAGRDGSAETQLLVLENYFLDALTWSPDGQSIGFMAWTGAQDHTVRAVSLTDAKMTQLTEAKQNAGWPAWASLKPIAATSGNSGSADGMPGRFRATNIRCTDAAPSRVNVGVEAKIIRGIAGTDKTKPIRRGAASREILINAPIGDTVKILSGPECIRADATYEMVMWWRVQYGDYTGWTSEIIADKYMLEPLEGQDIAPADPTATETLTPGGKARVYVRDDGLKLRSAPGTTARVIEKMPRGTVVEVIEGPKSSGGYTWWKVKAPSGAVGWAVQSADGLDTLVPMDS